MKLTVDIACPNCGHKLKQEIGQMHPGTSRQCPSCGTTIQFTGDDGRKVQREMDQFERTLKNFSRKLAR